MTRKSKVTWKRVLQVQDWGKKFDLFLELASLNGGRI
jgi:hypothetical protein